MLLRTLQAVFLFIALSLSLMIMLSSVISSSVDIETLNNNTQNTTAMSQQRLINYTSKIQENIDVVEISPNDERDLTSIMGRYAMSTIKMFTSIPELVVLVVDYIVDTLQVRQYVSYLINVGITFISFMVFVGIMQIALRWWIT